MTTLDTFTMSDLNKSVPMGNIKKGRGYLHRVRNGVRSEQSLTAEVAGSSVYQIELEIGPDGLQATCTCAYNWGGYCKHIAAVLLKWLEQPSTFTVKESATPAAQKSELPVIPIESLPAKKPQNRPFWLAEPFEERQQQAQAKLSKWLEVHKVQDLRDMAKKRGWTVKGTSKADLTRQISLYLLQPEEIEKAIKGLDAEHRQVLRALALLSRDQGLLPGELERVAGHWGALRSYKQITTYTRHLTEAGLAIPGVNMGYYGGQSDVIPRLIVRAMPPVLAEVIPGTPYVPPEAAGAELRRADPFELVRQAGQVALLLEQAPPALRPPQPRPRMERFYPSLADWSYEPDELVELSKTKNLQPYSDLNLAVPPPAWSLPNEAVNRLAPLAGDEGRLEFIFSLLVATGLFWPGSPVTVWSEVKEHYLRQTEAAQRATLARVYFLMLNWSELWSLLRVTPELQLRRNWNQPYYKPANLALELNQFRQQVLRVFASLPDDQWILLNDLIPLLRTIWPRFDGLAWQTYYGHAIKPGWYLTYRRRELKPDTASDWQLAQWPFIRFMLTGPLHWLGLADLCWQNNEPIAVRFHGLADLYWDRVETPSPPLSHGLPAAATGTTTPAPPSGAVQVEGLTIIVNPSAINAQTHNLLDRLARLDEAIPGRFIYRLEAGAVHQSFEAGLSLAEVLADWERLLGQPPPETIRTQLETWWQAYGQVRLYENVTLIEFGDDYALTEMKAVTTLEQHLIAEISPRLVLIAKEAVGPLTVELEKAGYTPKQTDQV